MKPAKLILVFVFISLINIIPRLYRLDRPLADWHSWRQADTAAVTRRYVAEGIDLLHPKYDDLSSIPSGLDNPQGYRMVEFPFINALIAYKYTLTSPFINLPVHVFSRLVAIAFSTLSAIFLFLIMAKLTDFKTGLISALVFALLPYNIFYSTTTLPEIPLVFFTLASFYFWIIYSLKHSHTALVIYIPLAAAAILLKPYYLFLAPALIYFYWLHQGNKGLRHWHPYAAAILALIPFFLWRRWILQFPEGIPNYDWLFNSTGIRFKGAFFRWLFADRVGRMILGYWGMIPFGLGLIIKPNKKAGWFFHLWILGMLAYFIVFATGNVTHDYYQIITVPIIAIFMGLGYNFMLHAPKNFFINRVLAVCFLLVVSLFSFAFGWFHLRDFFNINNPAIVAAGERIDQLTPKDAKVIAPYLGDTAFLYQTNRQGWPIGGDIDKKISLGATHYVTTTQDDEANELIGRCELLEQTDQYLIISLENCKKCAT